MIRTVPGNRHPERLSFALIALTFAVMLAFSWQKWADPIYDFGREMYVAWRLQEGDVLYRDIAHYYAPLSSYLNAAWLGLFGLSYRSLVNGNAIVLALLLFVVFKLLRRISNHFAATTATLVAILVFGFGQYLPIGNYNFLSPYSHELTHGLLFTVLAIAALAKHLRLPSARMLVVSGAFVGFVFLTKYEVFVAACGGALVTLAVQQWWTPRPARTFLADLQWFALGLVTPVLGCLALLTLALSPREALDALLGAYYFMFGGQVGSSQLLWSISGLTNAGPALLGIVKWTACCVAATVPVMFLGRGERPLDPRVRMLAATLLPVAVLVLFAPSRQWRQALLPLPFFLMARLAATLRLAAPGTPAESESRLIHLFLNVVSLLLLIRTPLNTSSVHYGFALALPGTLLLIVFLLDETPRWIEGRGLAAREFRIAALTVIAAFCIRHVASSAQFFAQRTYVLGEHGDSMRVDARGAIVAKAVQTVLDHVGPHETLVVFPEGALVNYLTRRRSPLGNLAFHPTALSMYGEPSLVGRLISHPPNYILSFAPVMRDLREMGCPTFGVDCARAIAAWQDARYAPLAVGVSEGQPLFTLLVQSEAGALRPVPRMIEVLPR